MDEVHINDVVVTTPKSVALLSKYDVVLLPLYGRSEVMSEPSILPGSNRTLVVLYVAHEKGIKRLICARNMSFQYEGTIFD